MRTTRTARRTLENAGTLHRRTAAIALLLFAPFTAPRPAHAQSEEPAREEAQAHFERGIGLMRNENWSAALVEFDRSLELYPTRAALFNRGNCLYALHRYVDALAALLEWQAEYADTAAPEEERAAVAALLEEIRGYLAEVQLDVEPDGAVVRLDGVVVGTAPLAGPIVVTVGPHVVEAESADGAVDRAEVTVASGDHAVLRLSPVPATGVDDPGPPPLPVPPPPPAMPETDDGVDQAWFWTIASTAVAAAAGAGICGGLAWSTHDTFAAGGQTDPTLRDRGSDLELAANALFGITAAAAVTALVLGFFTDFDGGESEPADGTSVAATPGGMVLRW
ncbi:MAG: hypothetical protein HY907_23055 [Deltaproteobacteria bacterium]|nr:hypothetical protein [Deltaproteobacteria bacterium]